MNEYSREFDAAWEENSFSRKFTGVITYNIPTLLKEKIDLDRYVIKASYGKGRWTKVPWIAVFDRNITTSAREGVYIVYLLNKDTKTLYLTLNQGATSASHENRSKPEFTGIASSKSKQLTQILINNARLIQHKLNITPNDKTVINSGSEPYDAGCILFKEYNLNSLPNDNVLYDDLKSFIHLYKRYYDEFYKVGLKNDLPDDELESNLEEIDINIPESPADLSEVRTTMPDKDLIQHINRYISNAGFEYPETFIENFFLSLKSKPFVLLAGISGTGKTKLVKLFSESIGAEYKLVPVRPDWSDSTDIFGHLDLNGKYITGPVTDFIKHAQNNLEIPHFLCFDEMNLARVEYYLSDFLSVMETRELDGKNIASEPLISLDMYGSDIDAIHKYGVINFPENLYVVGTVNMDETTFPFSKKVLDRANTIEFNNVDLMPKRMPHYDIEPLQIHNESLKSKYVILADYKDDFELVDEVCKILQDINKILLKASLHIGYRVRDEILFYMIYNAQAENLLSFDDAMDYSVLQKILPRIQGSSQKIYTMLCDLFIFIAGPFKNYSGDTDSEKIEKYLNDENAEVKYRQCADKIKVMIERYEEDGFTSYWS